MRGMVRSRRSDLLRRDTPCGPERPTPRVEPGVRLLQPCPLYQEHLRLARLQTLQGLLEGVLQARWRSLLGPVAVTRRDPDWANALALYAEVSRNRSLLQRLLRAEAQGDHEWARRHPANRAFLQAMSERGLDMGAWLDSHEVTRSVDGCPLRAVTETAPLRVLQPARRLARRWQQEGERTRGRGAHQPVLPVVDARVVRELLEVGAGDDPHAFPVHALTSSWPAPTVSVVETPAERALARPKP